MCIRSHNWSFTFTFLQILFTYILLFHFLFFLFLFCTYLNGDDLFGWLDWRAFTIFFISFFFVVTSLLLSYCCLCWIFWSYYVCFFHFGKLTSSINSISNFLRLLKMSQHGVWSSETDFMKKRKSYSVSGLIMNVVQDKK